MWCRVLQDLVRHLEIWQPYGIVDNHKSFPVLIFDIPSRAVFALKFSAFYKIALESILWNTTCTHTYTQISVAYMYRYVSNQQPILRHFLYSDSCVLTKSFVIYGEALGAFRQNGVHLAAHRFNWLPLFITHWLVFEIEIGSIPKSKRQTQFNKFRTRLLKSILVKIYIIIIYDHYWL